MYKNASMSVIGAGAYGTALSISLARNGHSVLLWGHNPAHIQQLKLTRCNKAFLPNIAFPPSLHLEISLPVALSASPNILIVVPSHMFSSILKQIKPYLRADSRIVWATKGLDPETGRLLQEVAEDILGKQIPLAVLSGPTFASELAEGLPTAITLAATDSKFSIDLQRLLHCDENFRVYSNSDIIGVQLGGAVKNVIAIGAGISDGIGFGANALTALITRGLTEMSRLGTAMGANPETFMGMAGLGDLILSCTNNQSRNRQFGILIGQGITIEIAKKTAGKIVEGYRNTKEVLAVASRYGIEMPITEQIYEVLYQGKDAYQAALTLLRRAKKSEKNNF
ncbi:glycerol-3-phosphate dehydrogenase [secondary endosymbiont of Heteropsylla cubana]|uniref:Glycerol-3-phosphate dehydrogenase [NAD(P)+] n=1 Tax=secondary endosymbiont of Heteropsylla cubana TaxID=134287 RepID=J3VTT0_9ENTR|nr:NAD(P)H-dependent glycerol-3-phosphate dehydrogenase [secondary endosymbiont of Heteropsylla cubana]AFP85406.1 glycerol-3-phosphate dehydrogenase [secondary endosymbiont of Heteropsylla cubana]